MSRTICLMSAVLCLGIAVGVFLKISTKQSQDLEQAKQIGFNAAVRISHLANRGEYSQGMDVVNDEIPKYNRAIKETKQQNADLSILKFCSVTVLSIAAVILICLGFRRPKNVEQQT